MIRKLWNKIDVEKLKKLRKKGFTNNKIAKYFKITENAVSLKVSRLAKKGQIKVKKFICDDSFNFNNIEKELLIKGLSLWLCEGTKQSENNRRVEFVNSDPKVVGLFMKFLRELKINEKKLRLRLKTKKEDNRKNILFWVKLLNVKPSNFIKSSLPKGKTTKYRFGTLTIRYNSKKLLEELYRKAEKFVF